MTRRYAEGTSVAAETSRAEIERILTRYGADAFMYGWEGDRARVQFRAAGRYIRFDLRMPDRRDRAFTHTPSTDKPRSPASAAEAWEAAVRQRWRALALVIKAKLEAVAAGITEFEAEFLAHVVLPDGSTVGDRVRPELAIAYETGTLPALLPDYSGAKE